MQTHRVAPYPYVPQTRSKPIPICMTLSRPRNPFFVHVPVDHAVAHLTHVFAPRLAAYERGIVHRDLTKNRRVKVLDFGPAKAMDVGPDGIPAYFTGIGPLLKRT